MEHWGTTLKESNDQTSVSVGFFLDQYVEKSKDFIDFLTPKN
jgi:hypothetical protein